MLKVDLVYSGYMMAPNGASMFVRKMYGLKNDFLKVGVELRVYSQESVDGIQNLSNFVIPTRNKWKIKLGNLSKYSLIVTRYLMYRRGDRFSKKILDYYMSLSDKGDIIAFQEDNCCYHYLRRDKENLQKVFLTLHSGGEFWRMYYETFPRFKSMLFDRYRKRYEKTLLNGCDKIGFVADNPRKIFCSLYPYDPKKTFFVYNGIEIKPYNTIYDLSKLRLVCVGTLCERKNQMGILNAIALLEEKYQKQLEITFVGGGDLRESLEKKASGMVASIIFTGSTSEVAKYLRQANCFCLFSKEEGLPISIVEAMRAGLPIIGSNIAGIPEQIIQGKTGYVVNLDEGELANTFKHLIDNLTLLKEMGSASYHYFVEKFTINAMVQKYAEIYQS